MGSKFRSRSATLSLSCHKAVSSKSICISPTRQTVPIAINRRAIRSSPLQLVSCGADGAVLFGRSIFSKSKRSERLFFRESHNPDDWMVNAVWGDWGKTLKRLTHAVRAPSGNLRRPEFFAPDFGHESRRWL